MTTASVQAISKSRLTKWASTSQWQIVKAIQPILEDELQSKYFILSKLLKTAMSSVVGLALGEVVRSCYAPTSSEAEMHSIVQADSVADLIAHPVLYHMDLLFRTRK